MAKVISICEATSVPWIGHLKAIDGLPVKDSAREALQYERIEQLANQYGLDPEFAASFQFPKVGVEWERCI